MSAEQTTGLEPVAGRKDALVKEILTIASDANEMIKEQLGAAGSTLGEARSVLTGKARNAAGSSGAYIKGHPWKVLGLATAVGVIAGILAYRR